MRRFSAHHWIFAIHEHRRQPVARVAYEPVETLWECLRFLFRIQVRTDMRYFYIGCIGHIVDN